MSKQKPKKQVQAAPQFLSLLQKELALAMKPAAEVQTSDTIGSRIGTRQKALTEGAKSDALYKERIGQESSDRARKILPKTREGVRETLLNTKKAETAGSVFPSRLGTAGVPGSEEVQQTAAAPFIAQRQQDATDAQKALQLIAIAASRGKSGSLVRDMRNGLSELEADPMQTAPILRMFTSPSAGDRVSEILQNEPAMNAGMSTGATAEQNALIEAQRLYQNTGHAPSTIQRDVSYYGAQIPTFLLEGEGVAKGLGLAGRGVMNVARAVAPKLAGSMLPEAAQQYLLKGILERGAIGAGERALARGAAGEAEHGVGGILREKAGELAKHEATATGAHSTKAPPLEDITQRLVYGY